MKVSQVDREVVNTEQIDYFYELKITQSERKQVSMRRVVGVMQFLGDAGGFHGSLMFIGAFLKFVFSGKDKALQLISEVFIISTASFDRNHPLKWLKSFRKGEIRVYDRVLNGSCLRFLACCLGCDRKSNRAKKLIALVE
mmetsp:Transcript_15042/g.20426  ORF Transcript_15042/g.20426 Transcript_15042/m.20426 type:complete len:140 (-) Transcript_15042:454-873(-)